MLFENDLSNFTNGGYRFSFNGQEQSNEISGVGNHTTAEFWEYETRLGRRWNVDPVVKPWESSYAVLSSKPIWKIDPLGNSDYFNTDGTFSHSTKKGSLILIITKNDIVSLSQYSANIAHSKACAEIVNHYRSAAGINNSVTIGVSPSINGISYATKNGIWIDTKGGSNELLNDFNNLINALVHENKHVNNKDPQNKNYKFQDHLNVYNFQMSDPTFSKTTNNWKAAMANNYARYLLGGYVHEEFQLAEIDDKINEFNKSYKNYKIGIIPISFTQDGIKLNSFGLNISGNNQNAPVDLQNDPH